MSGSHRVTVEAPGELPALDWCAGEREAPEAWPLSAPTWLAARDEAGRGTPLHTVARRARGEIAVLPGHLYAADDAEIVGLGFGLPRDPADLAAPVMVLGVPEGESTCAWFTFWTPRLFTAMVTAAARAAFEAGAGAVVAPRLLASGTSCGYVDGLRSMGATVVEVPGRHRVMLGRHDEPAELSAAGQDVERADGEEALVLAEAVGPRPGTGSGLARFVGGGADLRAYHAGPAGTSGVTSVHLRYGHRLVTVARSDHETADAADASVWAAVDERIVADAVRGGLRIVDLGSRPSHLATERSPVLGAVLPRCDIPATGHRATEPALLPHPSLVNKIEEPS